MNPTALTVILPILISYAFGVAVGVYFVRRQDRDRVRETVPRPANATVMPASETMRQNRRQDDIDLAEVGMLMGHLLDLYEKNPRKVFFRHTHAGRAKEILRRMGLPFVPGGNLIMDFIETGGTDAHHDAAVALHNLRDLP